MSEGTEIVETVIAIIVVTVGGVRGHRECIEATEGHGVRR